MIKTLLFNLFSSSKNSFIFNVKLMCLGMFFVIASVNAQATFTAKANGNWATAATWNLTSGTDADGIPDSDDNVIVAGGFEVITNGNRDCAGIIITGTLTMGSNNLLTVNGNVSGAGTWNVTGANPRTISLTGDWSFTGTTPSAGTGAKAIFRGTANQTLTGNITSIDGGTVEVNKTSGSVTLGNSITVANFINTAGIFDAGNFVLTSGASTLTAGTLRVGGSTWGTNYIFSTTPIPLAGFTIEYYNTNPVIFASIAYQNLTFSGSGTTANPSGDLTIAGNLDNSGGGTIDFNSRNVTFNGGAVQNIDGFTTTGIVAINKSGNNVTFLGNVNGGALNISNRSLNLGSSLTHSFTSVNLGGSLNGGSSILGLSGATPFSGTATNFTPSTGTVNLNASVNQSVVVRSFYNLTLSGTGTKTFPSSAVAISNNLIINSGIVADLSTATHTAARLTLGSVIVPSGFWGSSSSTATNKNDEYFAAVTGRVNVGACSASTVFNVTGTGGSFCSSSSGSAINLSGSLTGVNYQLVKGVTPVGAPRAGTGNAINFGNFNNTGTYTVIATSATTSCSTFMSGSVNIYRYSSPPTPTATFTNASCPGTATGTITVNNVVAPSSLSFVTTRSQYVDLRTTLLSGRSAFTVEGWIKFDATKVLPRMSIFGQNDVIEVAFEDGGVKCYTPAGSVIIPLSEITGGYVWHHIAATGDATSLKIYLDGGTPKTLNISTSNFGTSTDSTKMGYGVMDSGGTGLTGEVFKLGFWNRALTAGEITTLSSGFVEYDASLNGLLAGYSFNESSGSTIAGVGSAAPTGTLVNGPVWTDPYTYSWTSSPAGFVSSSKDISGLTDRTYILKTSLKGCTNEGTWTVGADNLATTITGQPSSTAVCVGNNTSFAVTATGTNLGYKWQVSTNSGGAFNDLTNNATYSNVTAATLNITAAGTTLNNYQYRCVVSGTCLPAVNSSAVTLTVNPTTVGGTITSTSPTNSLCTAINSITLTLSGQTGTVLRWESSTDNLFSPATAISNTTTSLPISNITTTTYYRAVVKSGACNTVTSAVIKITTGAVTATGATAPTCNSFIANWNKVDGARSYLLDVSTSPVFASFVSGYNSAPVADTESSKTVAGLLPNTKYYYRISPTYSCGVYDTPSTPAVEVTTSDLPIAGTFTGGAAAICIGEKTTFTNGTAGGTWSISNGTGTASITNVGVVTGGTQGQVNVVYTVTNGTCSNSISRSLTINPPFTAPTVGTVTPISCTAATGSIDLSGLPAGSWTITQSGFAAATKNGTGSTTTISGLAKGSYSFTVTSGSCTSGSTASIEIKDESSTIWNGTAWSNGNPTKDKRATITSVSPNQPFIGDPNPLVYKDFYACSLTVTNGSAEVVVPSNVNLIVTNEVVTSGNLRFKNNSSLVQVSNTATNSGNIFYERSTTPIFRKDYVYWSTPVNPQTLGALSPSSSLMYSNDGTQWVAAAKTSNMIVGSGYIVRAPDNYSFSTKQVFPAVFTGVPNNGDIVGEPLLADRSYVIGNPYPCALSADMLLAANKMLDGTIYFWTHNTPQNIGAASQYTPDDYAAYNTSGGVATSAKSDPLHSDNPANDNGKKPTGKIAAGQGFYVGTNLSGNVKFTNLMRLGASDNTQFFKPGAAGAIEKNRIWLNMTNTDGVFKQLLVSYIEGATNDYENRYDGLSFNANPYLDFYSVGNNVNYVIQGRALPFVDTDIVPLGYETTIKGEFTISIDEVDGKMSNQAIYLEDKITGEIHDLRTSDYTFKTEIGTFVDRLVLRYTGRSLGTGDFENLENGILVSVKNKVINVLSSKENIKEVTIFDVSGKLLYNKKKVGNTELQIANLPLGDQVLLVKVTLENDFTTTKKIVF